MYSSVCCLPITVWMNACWRQYSTQSLKGSFYISFVFNFLIFHFSFFFFCYWTILKGVKMTFHHIVVLFVQCSLYSSLKKIILSQNCTWRRRLYSHFDFLTLSMYYFALNVAQQSLLPLKIFNLPNCGVKKGRLSNS